MPSLVFNEANFKEPKKQTAQQASFESEKATPEEIRSYERFVAHNRSAKRYLWVGVISFMIIIGVLWGWSLKLQISSFRWTGSPEQELIEANQKNWQNAFAPRNQTTSTPSPQEKIKEALALIVANSNSTTTASSTPTTPNSTTTKH